MIPNDSGQSGDQYMEKDIFKHSCWDVIKKTSETLHINVFITNLDGKIEILPDPYRYGGQLLTDISLGFGFLTQTPEILHRPGRPYGLFREINCNYGLKMYSAPIRSNGTEVHGYIIIGPCILNRRLDQQDYEHMASSTNADYHRVWQEINAIKIISNVQMNNILNLVDDLVSRNIELIRLQERLRVETSRYEKCLQIEEFLKLVIKTCGADSASLMTIDENGDQLTIRNVYGQESSLIGRKIRVGEGIAGISAKEKTVFQITGKNGDNRIAHLLKRKDIEQSIVMPLMRSGSVQGVLNINTKKADSPLKDNFQYLQNASDYLAQILAV
jgi:hypothetical protein